MKAKIGWLVYDRISPDARPEFWTTEPDRHYVHVLQIIYFEIEEKPNDP